MGPNKAEHIKIDYQPHYLLVLKNGNILIGSYVDDCLLLYDPNFELIRKVDKINDSKIATFSLTCDVSNEAIFVSHGYENALIKLDSELNWIATVIHPNA